MSNDLIYHVQSLAFKFLFIYSIVFENSDRISIRLRQIISDESLVFNKIIIKIV